MELATYFLFDVILSETSVIKYVLVTSYIISGYIQGYIYFFSPRSPEGGGVIEKKAIFKREEILGKGDIIFCKIYTYTLLVVIWIMMKARDIARLYVPCQIYRI